MFFSIWAKLIPISLFLLELVSFEFLSFSVSSVSMARETTRSVHFPIIIIRRSLLLADRNCYGPIFGFQLSLSGNGILLFVMGPSSAPSTTGRSTPVPLFPYNGLTIMLAKERSLFKQLCGRRERSLSPLPFRKKNPG